MNYENTFIIRWCLKVSNMTNWATKSQRDFLALVKIFWGPSITWLYVLVVPWVKVDQHLVRSGLTLDLNLLIVSLIQTLKMDKCPYLEYDLRCGDRVPRDRVPRDQVPRDRMPGRLNARRPSAKRLSAQGLSAQETECLGDWVPGRLSAWGDWVLGETECLERLSAPRDWVPRRLSAQSMIYLN